MSTELQAYEWQKQAYGTWKANNYKGIIKAVPGAGKTIAGVTVIKTYCEEFNTKDVLIVAPTGEIIKQWVNELTHINLELPVVTYQKALKLLQNGNAYKLIVLDECHNVKTPKRSAILGLCPPHILGLSATPEDTIFMIGKVIIEVNWDEANISDFELTYVLFNMDNVQKIKYTALTEDIKRSYHERNVSASRDDMYNDENYIYPIIKRRAYVYEFPQRVDIALRLIEKNKLARMMVFAERIKQLEEISRRLTARGIKHSMITNETDTIQDFKDHKTNILLSAKMVKEGFNDPSVSVGIIVSTPLSARNQIQTIGRMVRKFPNKTAKIYCLLAKGTTDEDLLVKGTINKFKVITDSFEEVAMNLPIGQPCQLHYVGKEYSVSSKGEIFLEFNGLRKYLITDNMTVNQAAQQVLRLKGGGRFIITGSNDLLTMVGSDVIYLGRTQQAVSFKEKVEKEITCFEDLFK